MPGLAPRSVPGWLALLIALAACGGSGPADGGDGAVVQADSAGVPLVVSRGGGWPEPEAWRLEPDLTLGEVTGALAFGRIASVAPAPDGRLFVLDHSSQVVRVFDAAGGELAHFGGRGGGPGEFRGAAQVFPLVGGDVAVGEPYPPALHRFGTGLDYRGTRRPGSGGMGAAPEPVFAFWWVGRSGTAYVHLTRFAAAPGAGSSSFFLRLREAGADTLLEVPSAIPMSPGDLRIFSPRWVWAVREDGAWLESPGGASYEVRERRADGALARLIRREVDPIPVTREVRDSLRARMRREMAEEPVPPLDVDRLLGAVTFEAEAPPVARLFVSEPDGHLWVGARTAESVLRDPDAVGAFDVFDTGGRFLGRIPAPEGFVLHALTREAAYGVWSDVLDVPYVRRYRVLRPGEAGAAAPAGREVAAR